MRCRAISIFKLATSRTSRRCARHPCAAVSTAASKALKSNWLVMRSPAGWFPHPDYTEEPAKGKGRNKGTIVPGMRGCASFSSLLGSEVDLSYRFDVMRWAGHAGVEARCDSAHGLKTCLLTMNADAGPDELPWPSWGRQGQIVREIDLWARHGRCTDSSGIRSAYSTLPRVRAMHSPRPNRQETLSVHDERWSRSSPADIAPGIGECALVGGART